MLIVAEYNARFPEPPCEADRKRMTPDTLERLNRDASYVGIYAYERADDGSCERVPPNELHYDVRTGEYSRRPR